MGCVSSKSAGDASGSGDAPIISTKDHHDEEKVLVQEHKDEEQEKNEHQDGRAHDESETRDPKETEDVAAVEAATEAAEVSLVTEEAASSGANNATPDPAEETETSSSHEGKLAAPELDALHEDEEGTSAGGREEESSMPSRSNSSIKSQTSMDRTPRDPAMEPRSPEAKEPSENNAAACQDIEQKGEGDDDGEPHEEVSSKDGERDVSESLSVKEKAALFASGKLSSHSNSSLANKASAVASSDPSCSVRAIAARYSSGASTIDANLAQASTAERMEEVSEATKRRKSSVTMRQYWQTKEEIERVVVSRKEF
ncbi:Hypothetical Protein FCC1311_031512 [Hondaea fermentalgiana]|uniref:Uncharacterized protein n=1 Tax=Hondaea fermentalgiana TaxID=2315210 RepID=A0A2R5GB41_9STRA|nr:Hypothetical Protein FCC1311_031512 [Hondaea fermentalgiana]|eukprot:GBG26928.1 Hypothetical Protein FCC1311_031512 [Hondaea fermentalgiana]